MDNNDSIYGKYAPLLPKIMKDLTDRIEAFNLEEKEKTGFSVYEHLISRVKSEESMREKCVRKGQPQTTKTALAVLTDSIGVRVVTGFVDDIFRIADFLRNLDGWSVVTEKNYVTHAKPNGYRSYHMILEREVEGIRDVLGEKPGHFFAEIQLRTIAMDSWASLEHEMKYKRTIRNQEMIVRELKRCADELASCDITMQTIRDLIREDEGM